MDINKYILENRTSTTKIALNQVQFKIVMGLDRDNVHIPKWFKDKRVIALIDYCINEHIIDKNRILYNFSYEYDPYDIKFDSFKIMELTLDQLTILSNILPQPDLLECIKFKPSEPYHTPKFVVTEPPKNYHDVKRSKAISFYDLDCKLDSIATNFGTILID